MIISAIVAMGKSRQIGFENKLLWHIKEELQLFKKITMNHHIVMGRKTWDSIGRPLPGRKIIVLSANDQFQDERVIVARSKEEAISVALKNKESELIVCGGEKIYSLFMKDVTRLYLTEVDFDGKADAFFPNFERESFNLIEESIYPAREGTLGWKHSVLQKD